ncbi:receptor tyrosine-protein kinase erbB-2-like [Osmerus eperlanus]|uniref:receptor tyrosine-protein kinase erbB-2-like n=1 Tax=Osmerus eperlanus TaxID=29151 RepID=UPI002E0E5C74
MKLALPSSEQNHYQTLKLLYCGCQVVHGNLEITHLHGQPDLSFLQGIVEVQGYALVAHVSVGMIPLDSLRIIRGSQLFNNSYALAVVDNTAAGAGLRTLRLRNLTEEQGRVCDPLCSGGCWGPGPRQCVSCSASQRGVECVEECHLYQGSDGSLCGVCHSECRPINGSASCHGPGPHQCAECLHLQDGGVCVSRCPSGVKEEQGTVWKYRNASGHCLSCNTNCTLSCTEMDERGCPVHSQTG